MRKILLIIVILAMAGGVFFGGMEYVKSKNQQNTLSGSNGQNFRNLSPEQRQQMFQQFGANLGSGARAGQSGQSRGGALSGEIISKDDKSITIKLRDGGSKIVFFSETASITKSVSGSKDDLAQGEQVFVSGDQNSDGSISAKTIQVSPVQK